MNADGSSRDGLRFAIAAQQALDASDDSVTPVRVRMGLHVGEVVREDTGERADFYGRHVAMAARVASQASGGEVLVSSLLRELIEPSGEFAFASREPVAFKGLDGEHLSYAVGWA